MYGQERRELVVVGLVRVRVVVVMVRVLVVVNHRYPGVRDLASPVTTMMIEQQHWNKRGRWASAYPC